MYLMNPVSVVMTSPGATKCSCFLCSTPASSLDRFASPSITFHVGISGRGFIDLFSRKVVKLNFPVEKMDFSKFSDPDYEVKEWVNAALRTHKDTQTPLDVSATCRGSSDLWAG